VLRPLPSLRAAMRHGVTRKVDKLATVRIGSARYSVPHTLRGRRVDVSTVDDRIEIWHQDLRVAQHRLVPPGGPSILDEHYYGPARKPQRAVRPRTSAEKDFLALGEEAVAFLRAAAAAGTTRLLDRDDPGGAIPVAERVLRQLPLANKTQRATALELVVGAKSAAGDTHGAQVHLEELRSVAQAVPTNPLRAAASFCEGLVAAAAGDHDSAAVAFEDAAALFAASDAPYELGRARTELARTLAELGRKDVARREAAALMVLERTGASVLRKCAQQVLDGLVDMGRPAGPLTPRERQVLGLIAGECGTGTSPQR
jgi:hypothetical protein